MNGFFKKYILVHVLFVHVECLRPCIFYTTCISKMHFFFTPDAFPNIELSYIKVEV